jgi:hypothetical protein
VGGRHLDPRRNRGIQWLSDESRARGISMRAVEVNGGPGALFFDGGQRLIGITALEIADAEIKGIGSISNPGHLGQLGPLGNLGSVWTRDDRCHGRGCHGVFRCDIQIDPRRNQCPRPSRQPTRRR